MQLEAPEGDKEVAARGAVVVAALQRLARREHWDGEVAARHEVSNARGGGGVPCCPRTWLGESGADDAC